MCGRFIQERSDTELADIFEAEPLSDDPGGRYNVAPTDPASVVVERDGRRAIRTYRWGLVPHWATRPSGAARYINAREETLLTSGTALNVPAGSYDYCAAYSNAPATGLGTFTITWGQ